ncbi:MAG: hypothetical protein HY535_07245 [Chloroflexi bacterium]|nr:hypothetical protein [Chloroflexota bacterium]
MGRTALIEGTGYWQVLMPLSAFPSEVAFTQAEREALERVEEMLRSIRRGEVRAQVRLNKAGMAVSWSPSPTRPPWRKRGSKNRCEYIKQRGSCVGEAPTGAVPGEGQGS